jgi:hypothetical protein
MIMRMVPEEPADVAVPVSAHCPTQGCKLSDILRDIADDPGRDRITVRDLLGLMQDRAMATLLFVFAVPNVLPTPPGTSSVLGTPLIFLSMQLMLGARAWLPDVITERSIARRDFASVVAKISPWLVRAEALLRPRLEFLTDALVLRLIGGLCFTLAVILTLPIPLGNMLPAFAICVFSLGMLARDGYWIIVGTLAAIGAVAISSAVVLAIVEAALLLVTGAFG